MTAQGVYDCLSNIRGRAGLFIILFFLHVCLFGSSYTVSSTIVACETRLTENGVPPEPNLCWCKLNIIN